jgi:hypothetical protein
MTTGTRASSTVLMVPAAPKPAYDDVVLWLLFATRNDTTDKITIGGTTSSPALSACVSA